MELLRQQFPAGVGASLALSPDGSTVAVASGSNTHKLFVWQWQKAKGPRALKTPGYRGRALAFSPDGQRLADCSDIKATLRVWDVQSGQLLHKLESPDRDLHSYDSAAFTPDGKGVAVLGWGNLHSRVHLWNPATGKFLKRLDMGGGALAFSPNGNLLASGARVWDFATGKELSANDAAHHDAVARVVTGRGGVVVTASDDHTIRIWEAATGKQRRRIVHDGWVRAVALSPDGSQLVSSSLDDTVCLWDVATGRKIYQLAGHGQVGGHRAIAFTADGKSFLSWGDDMYSRWDARTGKALSEHAPPTYRHQGSRRGERVKRGRVVVVSRCWDLRAGLQAPGSPDKGHLLRLRHRHRQGVAQVLRCGELCQRWPSHRAADSWPVLGASRRPGGIRRRASTATRSSCPSKRLARLRLRQRPVGSRGVVAARCAHPPVEMASGREVLKIDGFRGWVYSLAFLPDGKRLVAEMEDSTALIWDLAP